MVLNSVDLLWQLAPAHPVSHPPLSHSPVSLRHTVGPAAQWQVSSQFSPNLPGEHSEMKNTGD